jgi:fluoride exporter
LRYPVVVKVLMGVWLAVGIGGAIGSIGRFWLAAAMTSLTGPRFPWGTLLINVLGSGIIGLVAGFTLTPDRVGLHPDVRIFLMTGVCGGFTTFSAFSLQTLELMQSGETVPALGYAVGSVVLCVLATYGGWVLGRL